MNELTFPSADDFIEKETPEASSRFVCFVLDNQAYGIAVDRIREVLRLTEVASVPGAPAACLGVINLRGRIVSVLDLRRMLNLTPARNTPQSRMLVVDHPQGLMALQVDRVMDLLTVPDSKIEHTPSVNSVPVPVAGIVNRTSGPLFVLNPEQLIGQPSKQVAA